MYITPLKVMFVEALRKTFDDDYTEAHLRNLKVSMEYPIEKHDYPSIWFDFSPTGPLTSVGIGHLERSIDEDEGMRTWRRWYYHGYAEFTIAALSVLDRDRIFDEMIRVLAFGDERPDTSRFRHFVENNDLIACVVKTEEIEQQGWSTSPGTPWGTDEIISEVTLRVEAMGEFLSDGISQEFVPLSAIDFETYVTDTEHPPLSTGPGWM